MRLGLGQLSVCVYVEGKEKNQKNKCSGSVFAVGHTCRVPGAGCAGRFMCTLSSVSPQIA